MGLLSEYTIINLNTNNKTYYIEKGYNINNNKLTIKTIDLPKYSTAKIMVKCDICGKEYETRWKDYNRRKNKDIVRCNQCYQKQSKCKTKFKNDLSFYNWCHLENRQDLLDRWDYELNDCCPQNISHITSKKIYFKCEKGIHKSEAKNLVNYQKLNLNCKACNSIAQWGIDNIGEEFLEKYWDYDKNTVDPWDISKGVTNTYIYIICNNCKLINKTTPNNFIKRGLSCKRCSDGISYPNKYGYSFFEQALGSNFETEVIIDNYRYDFKILLENKQYFVEMDGGWHTHDNIMSGQTKEISKSIDDIKDNIIRKMGSEIIRVDCEKSDPIHIKNAIYNTILVKLFDLNKIDWIKCHKDGLSSRVIDVANLYNKGVLIKDLANQFKLNRCTIKEYLKKAKLAKLCDYDEEFERNKVLHEKLKVICINTKTVYNSISEAAKSMKIASSTIGECCRHKLNSSGKLPDGTRINWMFYNEYCQLHNIIEVA